MCDHVWGAKHADRCPQCGQNVIYDSSDDETVDNWDGHFEGGFPRMPHHGEKESYE